MVSIWRVIHVLCVTILKCRLQYVLLGNKLSVLDVSYGKSNKTHEQNKDIKIDFDSLIQVKFNFLIIVCSYHNKLCVG